MTEFRQTWWPWAIIGVLLLFAAGLTVVVIIAGAHRSELVTEDYYARELAHQKQIERSERTLRLREKPSLIPGKEGGYRVDFPDSITGVESGVFEWYRPSNANLDRRTDLALDEDGIQILDTRGMRGGQWTLRLSWTANGEEYFMEEDLLLP